MAERIFIDTDDLRRLAQFTKGGLNELGDIKLDIAKAGTVLTSDPNTSQAYYHVMASIDAIGQAVSQDHDALVP